LPCPSAPITISIPSASAIGLRLPVPKKSCMLACGKSKFSTIGTDACGQFLRGSKRRWFSLILGFLWEASSGPQAAVSPVSCYGAGSSFVGDAPMAAALGDFNGDGRRDLAVAIRPRGDTFATTNRGVSILLGATNGTFAAPVSYSAGPDPVSV